MTVDGAALSLPRILCLHGGGVNGHVFRLQCRTIISQLATSFRLVFMDGPYESEPHPDIVPVYGQFGPFFNWLPRDRDAHALGASASMESILLTMRQDTAGTGPWVGVLGFSQGAKMALSLLWAQQQAERELGPGRARTAFRFGVIMAGSPPLVHLDLRVPRSRHVADATLASNQFDDWPDGPRGEHVVVRYPTLHVHGLEDEGLDRHRRLLALYCAPETTRTMEWDAGHRLPFKPSDVRVLVSLILDMAKTTTTAAAE